MKKVQENALLQSIVIAGLSEAAQSGYTELFDLLVARYEVAASEAQLRHLWRVLDRHSI